MCVLSFLGILKQIVVKEGVLGSLGMCPCAGPEDL